MRDSELRMIVLNRLLAEVNVRREVSVSVGREAREEASPVRQLEVR